MRKTCALFLVALLAACGQKQPPPAKQSEAGANIVPGFPGTPTAGRVARERPAALPLEGMRAFSQGSYPEPPSWLPIYPGANVKSGFARGGRIRGGNVIFETDAQPADVIAFYEKTATQAGFVQTMNNASGDTVTFAAQAGQRSMRITAAPIAHGSHVQMFWSGVE